MGRGAFSSSTMNNLILDQDHGPLSPLTLTLLHTATKSFLLCLANKTSLGQPCLCKQRKCPREEETQSETWRCYLDHSSLCGFPLGPLCIWHPPEPQHSLSHSHSPTFPLHHLPILPLPLLTLLMPFMISPCLLMTEKSSSKNSIQTLTKFCKL